MSCTMTSPCSLASAAISLVGGEVTNPTCAKFEGWTSSSTRVASPIADR